MQVLDAAAVRARLPYPALVEALRQRFREGCEVPPRHVHALGEPGATLLLMPAWRAGKRLAVKAVNVFGSNAARGLPAVHASVQLFDAATGVPLAWLDGGELTARRTVAASALAADYLARPSPEHLLVIGAGRLARELPLAMRTVRPSLRRFSVWARRRLQAEALAADWRALGLAAQACDSLEPVVRQADMVSCATLSESPLVQGRWLPPGCHLDLIGSFTPAMREADGDCLRRAAVWVDTTEALAKAGDLLQAQAEGAFDASALIGDLAGLCRATCRARGRAGEITLFKSVGTALEDLAAAELAVDGAGG